MYLAARYSRLNEMQQWREKLTTYGHEVTSRWVNGAHQVDDQGKPIGPQGEATVEGDVDGSMDVTAEEEAIRLKFLRDDLDDIVAADMLVAFTEGPRTGPTRGGRHVEFGYALAIADLRLKRQSAGLFSVVTNPMDVVVVGPRENLFTWHPSVLHFPLVHKFLTFAEGLAMVEQNYTLRRKA